MKTKDNDTKSMGCSKSSSKRKVYINTSLPQKIKKSQINTLNFQLKEL